MLNSGIGFYAFTISREILYRGGGVPDFNKNAPPHRPGALDAPELSLTPGNGVGSRCPQLFRSFQLNVGGAEWPECANLGAFRPFGTWGFNLDVYMFMACWCG